jgi:hypothetical protein
MSPTQAHGHVFISIDSLALRILHIGVSKMLLSLLSALDSNLACRLVYLQ